MFQVVDERSLEILTGAQATVNRVEERRFRFEPSGEFDREHGRGDTLDRAESQALGILALCPDEPFAVGAITSVRTHAGHDQIAESGESRGRIDMPAGPHYKMFHFFDRKREHHGFGVCRIPQPVAEAERDGVWVFKGGSEADAE